MLGSKDLIIVPEKHVLDSPGHFAKIWKKIEIAKQNLAYNKDVTISSLHVNETVASHAVDGNRGTEFYSCAQTDYGNPSWLQVDLGNEAVVRSVIIISIKNEFRTMKNFSVKVGNGYGTGRRNSTCALGLNIPESTNSLSVDCPVNTIGRYITVSVVGHLELCEIEVFGKFLF
ncbi:uncharacterized protein LOC135694824 [Rhopilema esculentum]|uniref:uncharacterized protein LOC135694824 n=1 Tax=Rhopilema esculentum TaxID=499914 RepID=UPI0031CF53BD|eukprot:gene4285-20481_t